MISADTFVGAAMCLGVLSRLVPWLEQALSEGGAARAHPLLYPLGVVLGLCLAHLALVSDPDPPLDILGGEGVAVLAWCCALGWGFACAFTQLPLDPAVARWLRSTTPVFWAVMAGVLVAAVWLSRRLPA